MSPKWIAHRIYQLFKRHPKFIPFRMLDLLWLALRKLHGTAQGETSLSLQLLDVWKRYNFALNKLELAARRETVTTLPPHLNIETTVRCNLKCPFCYRQTPDAPDHNAVPDMTDELFDKIVMELFPTARTLNTSLSGEPFIAKNLERILDAASRHRVKLHVVTNGTLLDPDRLPERLISNLFRIDFSFDSLDPELFNELRYPAKFDRVMQTYRTFAQRRSKLKPVDRFDLGISFIIGRRNARELPDVVDFLAETGGTHLVVGPLLIYEEKDREESLILEPELYNDVYTKAKWKAADLNIHFEAPPPFSNTSDSTPAISSRICELVYIQTLITTTGVVLPCCQYYPPRLGDLTRQDFKSIWNGRTIRTIRRTVNTTQAITPCNDCYLIDTGIRSVEQRKRQEWIFLSSRDRKEQY
ncbi:radical SAM protein [bacterium]|nr:radical SAM protein [candidate division CSSED10-310 bacterium]